MRVKNIPSHGVIKRAKLNNNYAPRFRIEKDARGNHVLVAVAGVGRSARVLLELT